MTETLLPVEPQILERNYRNLIEICSDSSDTRSLHGHAWTLLDVQFFLCTFCSLTLSGNHRGLQSCGLENNGSVHRQLPKNGQETEED
jgi:hypothetical protein